ncbi:unnamed protein product [Heterobilharzia americana]|nr:unnamed protein product [Heterobilharzia americana]
MIRSTRLSANIINSNPLYLKSEKFIVYSSDKSIVVLDGRTGVSRLLNGHKDSVVGLAPDVHRPHYVISSGLDGKVIVWDVKTCETVQVLETRFPIEICFPTADGYVVSHPYKDKHAVKSYDRASGNFTEIVEFPQGSVLTYKDSDFVACFHESEVIIYWINFNVSVRYSVPAAEKCTEKKKYTCIAAHPNDCIIATGNAVGEIFIWWNLCTQMDDYLEMLDPISDNWNENEAFPESDSFDDMKIAVKKICKEGRLVTYYPVHPSHVKRSVLHWHSMGVTSLCFTPCGAHLLSGGLEGVLVKWDMTDCFGGPQQRRFLPHLGCPISSVHSYGGNCEDTITVTLENNSFHILDGALSLIYFKQGFMQLPKRWIHIPECSIPKNLLILENRFTHFNNEHLMKLVLANGGEGKLQLMNVNDNDRNIQKIDITHQNIVTTHNNSKLPVVYSEVLLIAQLANEAEFTWLVTYESVKMSSAYHGIDDQSRLTWWQCSKPEEVENGRNEEVNIQQRDFVQFTPIDTYSMAHFGCSAVSMEFVPSERYELYVLLMDYRLMIWNFNTEYKKNPMYSPWIQASCHLLSCANPFQSTMLPLSSIITFGGNNTEISNYLLICSGSTLTLLDWEKLLIQSNPICTTKLHVKDKLLELWSNCKKIYIDKCTIIISPRDKYTRFFVVSVRGQGPRLSGERVLYAALCLIKCTPFGLEIISIIPDVFATCLTCHPSKSYLAVGLENGTVAVYKLQCDSEVKLTLAQCLPSFAPQPLCDRKHKGGVNRKKNQKKRSNGTQIISLSFIHLDGNIIPSKCNDTDGHGEEEIQLVGVMRTSVGRETGRRDLVYYGTRTTHKHPSEISQFHSNSLLQLVDIVSPVKFNEQSHPYKRKLDSDIQLEKTLKQISQYPIYTAPPPDQLLHQLLQKH